MCFSKIQNALPAVQQRISVAPARKPAPSPSSQSMAYSGLWSSRRVRAAALTSSTGPAPRC